MTSRHLVRTALATGCAVVALLGLTPPARAAGATSGDAVLSVSPAQPDPAVPVGTSYFVHSVAPGGTWTAEVAVLNTNAVAVDAWVDPVDGITSSRTGAVFTGRSTTPTGTAAWVTTSVASVLVAAHAHTVISFTVRVPAAASVGDHVAGIAFEDKQGVPGKGGASGITTVLRSVVAVQVVVPGPAVFLLKVFAATVGAAPTTGTSGLGIDMEDVGGLLGKPQLEIALNGPGGYTRLQTVKLDTLLPGDRINDELLWPDALQPGDYTLTVTEDGQGRQGIPFVTHVHLAATLLAIRPGHAPTVNAPTLNAQYGRGGIAPQLLGGVLGGVILLGGALVFVARRKQNCLHCNRSLRRARMVTVDRSDEMAGCLRCSVVVHNSGAQRLCRECLRTHLRPSMAGRSRSPA